MGRILIGSKVRERRKSAGITQAGLAARVGISASYLNLIEGDRRNIGGTLLKRIADELDVPLDQFGGAAERRLVDELGEITTDPLVAPLKLDPASAAGLASKNPAWARAVINLHRAYVDRSEAVAALSDRLNHDPFVSDTMHSMLTNVSAIRSAAEILDSAGDIDPAQRQRFVSIIAGDSRRLSDVSRALVGFFTRTRTPTRSITPDEEVDDFIAGNDNHFPRLEQAAQALRAEAGLPDRYPYHALAQYLQRAHGVAVCSVPIPGGPGSAAKRRTAHFDPGTGTLELLTTAPEPTVRFEMARLAGQLGAAGAIDAEIDASAVLVSPAARSRARHALASYLAAVLLMPYEEFQAAAVALRYDIDQLARRFNASFEQVCHRLVTLRRPEAQGVRFGFLRSDAAGHVSKRFALPRLPLPGHGGACPLWAVFVAFQTPGSTVRQLAQFPGGDRYLLLARAVEKERPDYGMPRRFTSIMLMCEALHAGQLVYGDGLDLSERAPCTPVGQACRVCVRQACAHRQEDPIIDPGLDGAPVNR